MGGSTGVPVIRVSCFRADCTILSRHVIRAPTITLSRMAKINTRINVNRRHQMGLMERSAHVVGLGATGPATEGIVEAGGAGRLCALAIGDHLLDHAQVLLLLGDVLAGWWRARGGGAGVVWRHAVAQVGGVMVVVDAVDVNFVGERVAGGTRLTARSFFDRRGSH